MGERIFDRVGIDDRDLAERKLDAFRRWALVLLAFESVITVRYTPYSSALPALGIFALAFFLCLGLGWGRRFARPALATAAVLELGLLFFAFPDNANHQVLALVVLLLLLLVDSKTSEEPADAVVCLQSIRWIVLGGFFWAGVAKLLSGHWFDAGFLTWRVAIDPGFARVFAWMIPGEELARLMALGHEPGAGPFRVSSPGLVLVSNLTWIAELLLPVGLLFASTRRLCVALSLALLVAIQLGAREVFFAGWMTAGFLLFLERDRLTPLLPVLVLFFAFQIGSIV